MKLVYLNIPVSFLPEYFTGRKSVQIKILLFSYLNATKKAIGWELFEALIVSSSPLYCFMVYEEEWSLVLK